MQLFVVDDGQPLNRDKHYRGIYVAMEKPRQVQLALQTFPTHLIYPWRLSTELLHVFATLKPPLEARILHVNFAQE